MRLLYVFFLTVAVPTMARGGYSQLLLRAIIDYILQYISFHMQAPVRGSRERVHPGTHAPLIAFSCPIPRCKGNENFTQVPLLSSPQFQSTLYIRLGLRQKPRTSAVHSRLLRSSISSLLRSSVPDGAESAYPRRANGSEWRCRDCWQIAMDWRMV